MAAASTSTFSVTLDHFINQRLRNNINEQRKEKIEKALRDLAEERGKIKTPSECHPRCFWCKSQNNQCNCKCGGKWHGQGWKLLENMNKIEGRLESLLEKIENEKEVKA